MKCIYCNEEAKYQFKNGNWCCSKRACMCPAIRKRNAEKCKERYEKGQSFLSKYNKYEDHNAWNKGLTKETSKSVKAHSNTLKRKYKDGELIAHNKGKKIWDEENKKRISQHRKKYLEEHPQKVPYLLNHSSKMSYPERYFKYVFSLEDIDLKYHLQVGRYQLDFYNEDKKKYVQIDGQSHYVDKKTIKIDQERTEYLKSLGWECMRVRWKDYRNMTLSDRKQVISNIKNFIK